MGEEISAVDYFISTARQKTGIYAPCQNGRRLCFPPLTFRDKLHYVKERENRIFHLNGYLLAMELFKTLMLGLQKNFHFL